MPLPFSSRACPHCGETAVAMMHDGEICLKCVGERVFGAVAWDDVESTLDFRASPLRPDAADPVE